LRRRRGYIKHFNDWHQTTEFQQLFAEKNHESVALYFVILELLSQKQSEFISISIRLLSKIISKKTPVLLKMIETLSRVFPDFNYSLVGDQLELELSNYSKILNTRCKTGPPNDSGNSPPKEIKEEKEIKEKNKNTKKRGILFENDLKEIAKLYPRSDGVREGILSAALVVETHNDLADLKTAIENYSKFTEENQIEFRFIRTFKKFISDDYWKDWIKGPSSPGDGFSEYQKIAKERGYK
jgi:hypothetical protein